MQEKLKCQICLESAKITIKYANVNNFDIYFCPQCSNAFTFPIPRDMGKYYHENYWQSPGLLGRLKSFTFGLFHSRRKSWVKNYLKTKSSILEIGPGEGNFITSVGGEFSIEGIEFEGAKVKNKKIIRVNFPTWRTKKKFDAIIFWESLEHVPQPLKYLKKANKVLKSGGLIFIEIPRFDCVESRVFKRHWFHLDPPRHLTHFTNFGLKKILKYSGFKILLQKDVPAYEYSVWGFTSSTLSILGIKPTDYFKKAKIPIIFIVLLPLLGISVIAETFFIFLKQSPINLLVAKKVND